MDRSHPVGAELYSISPLPSRLSLANNYYVNDLDRKLPIAAPFPAATLPATLGILGISESLTMFRIFFFALVPASKIITIAEPNLYHPILPTLYRTLHPPIFDPP